MNIVQIQFESVPQWSKIIRGDTFIAMLYDYIMNIIAWKIHTFIFNPLLCYPELLRHRPDMFKS